MKKILLSIVLLALALPVSAQNYILSIESQTIDTDKEIRLPIYLNNSINVGSVQIRLGYDPAVLSVYSDPILDKGDFISVYAPENSRNTSGYILITAMQIGSALSGNLTIGYVRSQALNAPASSSQIALSIIAITDDAGNDLIRRSGGGSGEIKEPAMTAIEVTPVTNVTPQKSKISLKLLNEMEKASDEKLQIIIQSDSIMTQTETEQVMQTGAQILNTGEKMIAAKATSEQVKKIAGYAWVSLMDLDVRAEAHEVQETPAGTPVVTPRAPFITSTALLLIMLILKYYISKNKRVEK